MFGAESDHIDLSNLDLDWLASDSEGHVALFSTTGGELPPDAVLRDLEAQVRAVELVLHTPPSTRALLAPPNPLEGNVWRAAAERGLFAFRSEGPGGPYRLEAVPDDPARLFDLPPAVALVAENLCFPQLRFRSIASVTADVLVAR